MTETDPASPEYTDAEGNPIDIPENLRFGKRGGSKPIPFVIDDDVFYAVAKIPADEFGQLSALLANMPKAAKEGKDTEVDQEQAAAVIANVMQMMEMFLTDESAARLTERMGSKENPVDIKELMDVVKELMQSQYGATEAGDERPTNPTSD